MEAHMKRGLLWSLVAVVVLSVATTPAMAAGKTNGLTCTVPTLQAGASGVGSDGNTDYSNGGTKGSVKCFLGAGGKNFDLVTYSTGRKLTFSFAAGADQSLAALAGLEPSFTAEVDAYGINYYSQYLNMGIGTTAQVQMDVQFHYGGGSTTYELSYACLAVRRTAFSTWVITSEPDGSNQFAVPCLSNEATLSKIRRNSVQGFGEVNMPITFTFSPQ